MMDFVERGKRAEEEARAVADAEAADAEKRAKEEQRARMAERRAAVVSASPESPPAVVNMFLVGVSVDGQRLSVLRPVPSTLTKGEALNLAAWLVALADYESDHAVFRALLEAVDKT